MNSEIYLRLENLMNRLGFSAEMVLLQKQK